MAPKEPYRQSKWADVSPLLKYFSGEYGPFGAFRRGATAPLKYFSSGRNYSDYRAPTEPLND